MPPKPIIQLLQNKFRITYYDNNKRKFLFPAIYSSSFKPFFIQIESLPKHNQLNIIVIRIWIENINTTPTRPSLINLYIPTSIQK